MLDDIRSLMLRAIETRRGDWFPPIYVQKRVLRGVHRMLGSPLAPKSNDDASTPPAPKTAARAPEPAPVMVYKEGDRNIRERIKIEDALKARNIPYRLLDVTGDDSTKAFVVQAAGCEEDDLPVVFVGGDVVGTFNELVQWDVSGKLMKSVFGTD